MSTLKKQELPFWREYPERDTEFVRIYPTLYGAITEKDIWKKDSMVFYVHIPFCKNKCLSCPYILGEFDKGIIKDYVAALKAEISNYAQRPYIKDHVFAAGYIGGGTPASLDIEDLVDLSAHIKKEFNINDNIELTIETTPLDINEDKAKKLLDAGFNRISIGVQSFIEKELKELKRLYNKEKILSSINILKSTGFENVNIDLMTGIPGQTLDTWQETLSTAIQSGADSISFYTFFLLETTELMTKMISGRLGKIVEKTEQNEWFFQAEKMLADAGYCEIQGNGFEVYSGYTFSKSQKRSKYVDLICGYDLDTAAIGSCALGHIKNHWYYNEVNVKKYIEKVKSGALPLSKGSKITAEEYLSRALILGIKTGKVLRQRYIDIFGIDFVQLFGDTIADLEEKGLVKLTDDALELTRPKGYYYLSNVCKAFYEQDKKKQPQLLGQAITM